MLGGEGGPLTASYNMEIKYRLRSQFGVLCWIGMFSCGCGAGKISAHGRSTCSVGRNLEHVPDFRTRHNLLFLGFGLGLKGITPSVLKFY